MLDWKNRAGSAKGPAPEPKSANRGYFRNLLLSKALLSVLGLYLLVTGALGWYWSEEPALFPVQQNAQIAAEKDGKQMVVGFTTVETLKTVVGTLLNKPVWLHFQRPFPAGPVDGQHAELGVRRAGTGARLDPCLA